MKSRFREAFEEEDGDSSRASSPESEEEEVPGKQKAGKPEKKKGASGNAIRLEDLQELGFRSGPSILTMKEQPPDLSYEWGNGGAKVMEEEEDFEARQRTRTAANQGTEAALAKAKDNQAKLSEQLRKEREEHSSKQQHRRDTYSQREKRKRETGQAKKASNYVEDEKRQLRKHNIYSGFDN